MGFINMGLRQSKGRRGSVDVLPSIVPPALVRPRNESGVLRIGCPYVRWKREMKSGVCLRNVS